MERIATQKVQCGKKGNDIVDTERKEKINKIQKQKERGVALSEKRLTRTKEQKRSIKACRISEF